MKSDNNGVSTCVAGQESYETFTRRIGRKRLKLVQYDYRTLCGDLFSTVAVSLNLCRKRRDAWLEKNA